MSLFQGAAANVALRRRLSDKDKERRLVRTFIFLKKREMAGQLSAAHPTWLMVLGKLKIKMCFS